MHAYLFVLLQIVGLAILAAPIVYVNYLAGLDADYWTFVQRNYPVFFGMPYAAFFAYFLVKVLESSRGVVEVEFLTAKFKGAAGPLVFWLLIFLAILSGLRMLWQP